MLFSKQHPHILYVGTTTGIIYQFDIRNMEILRILQGHTMAIMKMTENLTHNVLVTAGDDKRCLVFKL